MPSIATGQGGNFLPSFASSSSSSFPYRRRAAPAPNPEDFPHHSSAHKLPQPTTTQLPTRGARAS